MPRSQAEMIAKLHQDMQEIQGQMKQIVDMRMLASGQGAIDITSAVRDSDGRVGSLQDLLRVNSDDELELKDAPVIGGLYKITAGSSQNWTIQAARIDNSLYGTVYTGVKVVTGHNESLASGDYVLVQFQNTSAADDTLVPRISNFYKADTT